MARQNTAAKKKKVLEAIERGSDVVAAADYAEVARSTVYKWLKDDSAFAEEWEVIHEVRLHQLSSRAHNIAMGGSERMLMFLIGEFRRKIELAGGGQREEVVQSVGEIHVYGIGSENDPGGDFIQFVEVEG